MMIPQALLMIAAQAGAASLGGKIAWEPEQRYEKAMEEAKASGRPVILYFTADWAGPARQLETGAFSDDRVMEAAWGFVRVIFRYDKAQTAPMTSRQIQAFPTLVFLDPELKEVDRWVGSKDSQNPETIAQLFRRILENHGRDPAWSDGLDAALRKGRAEGTRVLAFWTDGRPDSDAFQAAFRRPELDALRKSFVWVRLKHRRVGDGESRRFGVTRAPLLLAIDPGRDDDGAKEVGRFDGPDPARLKADLEALLKDR